MVNGGNFVRTRSQPDSQALVSKAPQSDPEGGFLGTHRVARDYLRLFSSFDGAMRLHYVQHEALEYSGRSGRTTNSGQEFVHALTVFAVLVARDSSTRWSNLQTFRVPISFDPAWLGGES